MISTSMVGAEADKSKKMSTVNDCRWRQRSAPKMKERQDKVMVNKKF